MKFDKQEEAPKKEDPQESMMNMMKKLYQEGDDEMKKTIAQAWVRND
jgi:calcyclin binding protein